MENKDYYDDEPKRLQSSDTTFSNNHNIRNC